MKLAEAVQQVVFAVKAGDVEFTDELLVQLHQALTNPDASEDLASALMSLEEARGALQSQRAQLAEQLLRLERSELYVQQHFPASASWEFSG